MASGFGHRFWKTLTFQEGANPFTMTPPESGVKDPVMKDDDDKSKRRQNMGRLALVGTSPQGVLNPATTGRKKLTAY